MIIIGVTGSIGMGKSTIASMLNFFGVPVHDSDLEVKKLIENNVLVKEKIKKEWPSVVLYKNGVEAINKNELSEIVFKNLQCKIKLENIIHPLIHKERKKFVKKHKYQKNIIALDVPLLYETGLNKICDYIFLALTSQKIQKNRVLNRFNMSEEKFLLIKKNQWSNRKKISQKPYIINTSYGKPITFIFTAFLLFKIVFKEKFIRL